MARIRFPGMKIYEDKIHALGKNAVPIIKAAVYDGAREVADSVKANLDGLHTISDFRNILNWKKDLKIPGKITELQKEGLLASFGLASMENDGGFINTKIGFDGYNEVVTGTYPSGQPNALVARACESGSSAMIKQPFIRTGVAAARKAAEKAMEKKLDEKIDEIMK